jgi:hypothetical protein
MKRMVMSALALAMIVPGGMTARAASDKSAEVLSDARKAIGGEARINAVKTIVATGKSQRQMGQMQMSGELEVAIALPDRYVRTQVDNIMGNSITREEGFNGSTLLERSVTPPGANVMIRFAGPEGDPDSEASKQRRVQRHRNELARLLVAWLLTAPSYTEAQFSYAGEAESPDGMAHMFDVKGADGLAMRVFIDKETRRPLMLTFQGRPPMMRTQRARAGEPAPTQGHGAGEVTLPPMTEITWFIDDFRKVGDLWLPHRMTQAADGKTIEEWEFSKIVVNEPLKDDRFKS